MDTKHIVGNTSNRRTIHHSASYHDNLITYRNPLIVAWWSAAFPGFGHLMLCQYITGFLLFTWEVIVNVNGGINTAIYYSFIGEFDQAKEILDPTWALMYVGVYIFAIWDTYRRTVQLNKIYFLAYRENSPLSPFKISSFEINYLDKRQPWIAVMYSAITPGLGYLYINRLPSAIFTIIWWGVVVYFSNFHMAIFYTMTGNFAGVMSVIDIQWLLFIPSIYMFSIYDSYAYTVELNKIFEKEQINFLIKHYQHTPSKTLVNLNKSKW